MLEMDYPSWSESELANLESAVNYHELVGFSVFMSLKRGVRKYREARRRWNAIHVASFLRLSDLTRMRWSSKAVRADVSPNAEPCAWCDALRRCP